jgi:hypothetical protein
LSGGAQQQRSEQTPASPEDASQNGIVSTPVLGIIHTMSLKDAPAEVEIVNSLRNLGSLSLDELRAVGSKAKELGFDDVRRYCKSELSRLDSTAN